MNLELRITIFVIGAVFFGIILKFLYTRNIEERNGMIWIIGSILFLFLMFFPKSIDAVAAVLGIDYPPTLLFLLGIVVILLILMHQAIEISVLRRRVKELTELIAIHYHSEEHNGSYSKDQEER